MKAHREIVTYIYQTGINHIFLILKSISNVSIEIIDLKISILSYCKSASIQAFSTAMKYGLNVHMAVCF